MSGGTVDAESVTGRPEDSRRSRKLRPAKSVLITGVIGMILCPGLGVLLLLDYLRPGTVNSPPFFFVVGAVSFTGLLTLGGFYLVLAWARESLHVTDRGLVWDELFRRREVRWTEVQRAEWQWDNQAGRIKLHSERGRVMLPFSQFSRIDRRWLMELIRTRLPIERQSGWERIEEVWARRKRPTPPVPNGDRWLLLWALVGAGLLLPVLPGVAATWLGPVRPALGAIAVLLCPVILVMSAWDLIRGKLTASLAVAFTISVLNGVLMSWVILQHIGR